MSKKIPYHVDFIKPDFLPFLLVYNAIFIGFFLVVCLLLKILSTEISIAFPSFLVFVGLVLIAILKYIEREQIRYFSKDTILARRKVVQAILDLQSILKFMNNRSEWTLEKIRTLLFKYNEIKSTVSSSRVTKFRYFLRDVLEQYRMLSNLADFHPSVLELREHITLAIFKEIRNAKSLPNRLIPYFFLFYDEFLAAAFRIKNDDDKNAILSQLMIEKNYKLLFEEKSTGLSEVSEDLLNEIIVKYFDNYKKLSFAQLLHGIKYYETPFLLLVRDSQRFQFYQRQIANKNGYLLYLSGVFRERLVQSSLQSAEKSLLDQLNYFSKIPFDRTYLQYHKVSSIPIVTYKAPSPLLSVI